MEKNLIIDDIETNYIISDEGYVKNKKIGKIIAIKDGAVQLTIGNKRRKFSLGRLVGLNFIPNPENFLYIKHIDGNKDNNQINNLKWISASENSNNTWMKRRENGNTGAGIKIKRKQENIVGNVNYTFLTDEKQIELDGTLIPYAISKNGKVRSLRSGKYITGSILHTYQYINFRWEGNQKNKAVHRLVAEAFIPNPKNYTIVDHIDGDRLNNCVDNLRWVSARENANNIHLDKTPDKPFFPEIDFSEEEIKHEVWKEYKDYKISSLGRVSGKYGRILKGSHMDCGYISYSIEHRKVLGHILVWEAFNGKKPEKMVINHINGNKHDNRLINLELTTHQENMMKASEETNAWNFREVGEFDNFGNMIRKFANASVAARDIGILPGSMRNTIRRNGKCHNGYYYRYLENSRE